MNEKTVYQFRQGNMYCTMCLLNIANSLSKMTGIVTAYDIDLNKKTVRIELAKDSFDEKTIRTYINTALTKGIALDAVERKVG